MSKVVITKENAEKVAVSYSPKKFPTVITASAHSFVAFNSQKGGESGSSFRIDRLVAQQTGVADLERMSIEEKVEREALLRLKEFQEQAYQEAYQLGLDEGRERAFLERSSELTEKLQHLDELLTSVGKLKTDLISFNETQIVRMVFYMAKRLVYQEVTVKPEIVLEAVKQALLSAQSDENVTVRVSPKDFKFIESVKEKLGKEFESLKRARLDSSEDVTDGGCVVETNYGDVNATLEQRLARVWEAISEKLPKVKNVTGAGPGDDASGSGNPEGA